MIISDYFKRRNGVIRRGSGFTFIKRKSFQVEFGWNENLSTADSLSPLILKVIFQLPAQCWCLNLLNFLSISLHKTLCVCVCVRLYLRSRSARGSSSACLGQQGSPGRTCAAAACSSLRSCRDAAAASAAAADTLWGETPPRRATMVTWVQRTAARAGPGLKEKHKTSEW